MNKHNTKIDPKTNDDTQKDNKTIKTSQTWDTFLKKKSVKRVWRPLAVRSVKELSEKMQEYIELLYEYNNNEASLNKKFPSLEWFAVMSWISVSTLYRYADDEKYWRVIEAFKSLQGEILLDKISDKKTFTPWQQFLLKNILKDHYKDKIETETTHTHTLEAGESLRSLVEEKDNMLGNTQEWETIPSEDMNDA